MDPITAYQNRRRGFDQSLNLTRDQMRLQKRAGSIGGVRNVGTDSTGARVVMPTSAQIGAGTAGRNWTRSQSTRQDRVNQAMTDGTFQGKREQFNGTNTNRWMDSRGNIVAKPTSGSNPYVTGGQSTVSTPTPSAPTTPVATATPAAAQSPAAPAAKPAPLPAGPLPPKGRVFDGGKDVTADIQKGLQGNRTGAFYQSKAPGAPAPKPAPGADINMGLAKAIQGAAPAMKAATTPAAPVPKADPASMMTRRRSPLDRSFAG